MIKKIVFMFGFIGCALSVHSQLPSDWTRDTLAYQMNLTSKIEQNCVVLNDVNNAIGAFVGGVCRGYAYTDIDASGDKLAFVTIYSSMAAGEVVELRFYDASTSQVGSSLDSVVFQSDAVIGSVAEPFIVTNNHRPTAIDVSNLVVLESSPIGHEIGTITATDQDAGQTMTYSLTAGMYENDSFAIGSDKLLLNSVLNYSQQQSLQIEITVDDGGGCTFSDTFTVIVDNQADTPTDIIIDTLSVTEGNYPYFYISSISTVDADNPYDNFEYELVDGGNSSDNDQFAIVDDQLYILTQTNYDVKTVYHIRVRTTDQYGLSFEKPFDIEVIDVEGNDFPLPAATYISNNGDGYNDFFKVENVIIYNHFALTIFDQFGNVVYNVNENYNNDFDGTQNGKKLPSGAYYYVFKSDTKEYKGNITIVN